MKPVLFVFKRFFHLFPLYLLAIPTMLGASTSPDSLYHMGRVISGFEAFFEQGLVEFQVPGAAVVVVKDNKVVYLKTFGVRQVDRPEPVDVHTVFRLSSLSKGFAATLTGVLVQEGRLDWDDTVMSYLPNFMLSDSSHAKALTIRHLLSHTTGLPPHAYTNLLDDNVPYNRAVKLLDKVKLHCPVGHCFAYQNVAFSLIGDIIEGATGQKYSDALKHRLLLPLGMYDASSTYDAFIDSRNRATPHVRSWNKAHPIDVRESYYTAAPAAGVNASITDMADWLRAQLGAVPDVVSAETLAEMQKPLIPTSKRRKYFRRWSKLRKTYYGLGWRLFDYSGSRLVYHGGYVRGFRSEIAFQPEQKIGLVVLMNAANPLIGQCVPKFFNLYLGLEGQPLRP
ncbi:beta-lactamase family protein [bacterium]|nr:beta-lactamase family protein [bacterium]